MVKKPSTNNSLSSKPHKKLGKLQKKGLLVCVGLDPNFDILPKSLTGKKSRQSAIYTFNKKIIDATASFVCAFKPNAAFYEGEGIEGIRALEKTFAYLKDKYADQVRILDAKRADIGNTNTGYAKMAFDWLGADALTIAPYMGGSLLNDGERKLASLEPFLDRRDKLIFVLCRTSNPDAGEFQDLPVSLQSQTRENMHRFGSLKHFLEKLEKMGISKELKNAGYREGTAPLYLVLAYKLANDWNKNGNLGIVVGSTYPRELLWIRKIIGDMPILSPGFGAQGGDIENSVKNGLNSKKLGLIVNSSRDIIFAGKTKSDYDRNFAKYSRDAVVRFASEIKQYL